MTQIRVATSLDVPAIAALIEDSARGLSEPLYSPAQIGSLLRFVFGVDSQLIADRTYYVCEEESRVVAAGGWSRRRTLYGGDQMKAAEDQPLDPSVDPARIRAFYVHPHFARKGLATQLYQRCAEAAVHAGFKRFSLMATLPGEAFYRKLGFERGDPIELQLPDGVTVSLIPMSKEIED